MHFHRSLTCLQNQDKKIKKKISADFPFLQFPFMATLSHWYGDWVKAALACFETSWNAVRGTKRSKCWRQVRSQCGEAARQRRTSRKKFERMGPGLSKIKLKALIVFFRTRAINRFSDFNNSNFAV